MVSHSVRRLAIHVACFPMVQFSRIDQGRLNIAGAIRLAPNFCQAHTIRFGWSQMANPVDVGYPMHLCLRHDEVASAATRWPWVSAEQHSELVGQGTTITLTLKNMSDRVMPAGMGLHPHFPLPAASADKDDPQINLLVRSRIRGGRFFFHQRSICMGRLGNLLFRQAMADEGLDDVFGYGSGLAQICWLGRPWSLSIEPDQRCRIGSCMHLGGIYLHRANVSHFPNAINVHPRTPSSPW